MPEPPARRLSFLQELVLKPDDLQRVLAYLREREPDWYPLFLTMALAITRSMIGHETEEMFLHYSHIERDEKHNAVEREMRFELTTSTLAIFA